MAHVGQELGFGFRRDLSPASRLFHSLGVGFDTRSHVVEALGKIADFIDSLDLDPPRKLAVTKGRNRDRDRSNRTNECLREERRKHDRCCNAG